MAVRIRGIILLGLVAKLLWDACPLLPLGYLFSSLVRQRGNSGGQEPAPTPEYQGAEVDLPF